MSTNKNDQNGRQPPLSNPPPPNDFRPSNVSDQQKPICRKYVWGTCTKNTLCKFRHELNLDEMKRILKFCHDYQNKQGCTRVECTYLHTTRDEENLFLATGQLPRALAERYAAMSDTPGSSSSFEIVPQNMMMYGNLPPPPPMLAVAAVLPPPPPPQPLPTFSPVQQPPPPPPPQTMPSTPIVQNASVFSAPPPHNVQVMFPMNQPPPSLPPMFDASRPPPPIPKQNGAVKRRLDHCEAGPSKIRKGEATEVPDSPCEKCVQRELRIDMYKQQMEKMQCEEEYQSLIYKKKLEEYEFGKEFLRSLVGPELYRLLEEYLEGGPPQVQDILASFSQNPFFTLLEYVYNNSRTFDTGHSSSLRLDETFMQSFSSLSRRSNPIGHSTQSELIQVIEILRNSLQTSDRSQAIEPRSNAVVNPEGSRSSSYHVMNNVNGFNHFSSGQKVDSPVTVSAASASRYSTSASSVARTAYPGPGVPGPSGLNSRPSRAPAPASPAFPSYHPGIPPPGNRPYYPQQYASTSTSSSMPNMPYNTATRPVAPVTPQMPARPSTSSVAPTVPPNVQNYNQYMMGRYPHPPHYYPPFQ